MSIALAAAASGSATPWRRALSTANCRPVRYAGTASRSGTSPMWRYISGRFQAVAPSTRTRPADGASRPAMRCRSVDLPAPLGPSSPVTPAPRANEMSLTATTLPYQRETWSTSSAGVTPGGAVTAGGAAVPADGRPCRRAARSGGAAPSGAGGVVGVMPRSGGSDGSSGRPRPRCPRPPPRRRPSPGDRPWPRTSLSGSDPKIAAFVPARMSAGLSRTASRARSTVASVPRMLVMIGGMMSRAMIAAVA